MVVFTIEAAITVLWLLLVAVSLWPGRRRAWERLTLLAIAALTSLGGELVNELVFAEHGAQWIGVGVAFPGFHFPIAVLMGAGLSSWVLFVCLRAVARIPSIAALRPAEHAASILGAYLLLCTSSWAIEFTFTRIGYWELPLEHATFGSILIGTYVYHLLVATPAIGVAWWVASRDPGEATEPVGPLVRDTGEAVAQGDVSVAGEDAEAD